ncbi:hypothetical protein [Flavobacterium laiguense]|uniref:hypothetical protein n=1 Tax=Flavobacterium laiguense TaxID=2169409 RepID=UPI0016708AAD|nr:hypothetical protein [Flavobacterium laiguense]
MLKNILNLEGAQKLTKNEQKSINGGRPYCSSPDICGIAGGVLCNDPNSNSCYKGCICY